MMHLLSCADCGGDGIISLRIYTNGSIAGPNDSSCWLSLFLGSMTIRLQEMCGFMNADSVAHGVGGVGVFDKALYVWEA
jgi:hypothetical protein